MRFISNALALAVVTFLNGIPGQAQGTDIPFGGLTHDTTLPVEMAADQLSIDQSDGSAVFAGNVTIGQGEMRITAERVRVEYAAGDGSSGGQISRLMATGGVLLVNGAEAAEAAEAVYSIESGEIVMQGNVILTQGQNVLSANRMIVNLTTGTARMTGRVRTILQSGGN